jgi:two-component system, cell cycle sensor histidine kinase and response regulator CckA
MDPTARPPTILLVEDEPAVRSLARKVLERSGFTVVEAADPAAAIELEAGYAGRIDLLLSDVVMPGMSGQVLADRLVLRRPGMRVLFMSGYNEEAILHQGILREGAALLTKPFSPNELLDLVRLTLGDAA